MWQIFFYMSHLLHRPFFTKVFIAVLTFGIPSISEAQEPLAAFSSKAVSQTNIINFYLSVDENLKDFMLAELRHLHEAKWQLIAPNGAIYQGEGNTLATYSFNQTGAYTISFTRLPHQHNHDGGGCDHYYMPDQVIIQVNQQKIEFLSETLSTSKPIVGGQPTNGTTLTIQVKVTGTDVPMPQLIYSAGVETTIVATLNPSQATLSSGLHTLTYQLIGQGLPDSYISFNFPDANGHLSACVYPQKL